jgi:hypothetical protein
VERTFAWISKHRRTVRDYETLPASHEAMILWAMIALMSHRLIRAARLKEPPPGTPPRRGKNDEAGAHPQGTPRTRRLNGKLRSATR